MEKDIDYNACNPTETNLNRYAELFLRESKESVVSSRCDEDDDDCNEHETAVID